MSVFAASAQKSNRRCRHQTVTFAVVQPVPAMPLLLYNTAPSSLLSADEKNEELKKNKEETRTRAKEKNREKRIKKEGAKEEKRAEEKVS